MKTISPRLFSQLKGIENLEEAKRESLSIQPGWFYLRLQTILNNSYRAELLKNNIDLSPFKRVESGWYRDYFDEDQIIFLKSNKEISLFPVKKQAKISKRRSLEDTQSKYLVEAPKGWTPKDKSKATHLVHNFYVVEDSASFDALYDDPKVGFISKFPARYAANRFTSGFVQSGIQTGEFMNGSLVSPRTMHKRGLNGEGEVVTFVDSGVDALHPMFYDPNTSAPIGFDSETHRKIKRIYTFADGKDTSGGHGTHVSGTAVGEALCENCSIALYNGIAPKAKMIMGDIGYINEGSSMSGDYDIEKLSRDIEKLGSYINSNSWGADEMCDAVTWIYNSVAYYYPNQIFLFAAGNSGREMDLSCPADGKNVLSIGAAARLPLSYISDEYASKIYVECGDERIEGKNSRSSRSIFTYNVDTSKTIYQLEKAFQIEDDMTGKVFVSESATVEDIKDAFSKGAEAAVTTITISTTMDKPTITVSDSSSFEKIKAFDNITIVTRPKTETQKIGRASFSSRGPSVFSSYKPDVIVPGSSIYSARSGSPRDETVRSSEYVNLMMKSGTSMATPAASGMAAIFRQFFTQGWYPTMKKGENEPFNPSSALIRALFITSSRPAADGNTNPNYNTGYGIPAISNVYDFENGTGFRIINDALIKQKQKHTYKIHVDGNKKPLVITLAYNDYVPDYVENNNIPLSVNLDLIVITPDGTQLRGNNREELFTANERVFIDASSVVPNSDYEIVVLSNRFPSDYPDTNYSLVVTGDFKHDDFETNPKFLERVNSSNLKCVNGVSTENGCTCNAGFAGTLCDKEFQSINVNEFIYNRFNEGEVSYFKTKIDTCSDSYPPTLALSITNGKYIHMSFSSKPFEDIYDEGVYHYDMNSAGTIQVDCPENGYVYSAVFVASTSWCNCRFQVLQNYPKRTPEATSSEAHESSETQEASSSKSVTFTTNAQTSSTTNEKASSDAADSSKAERTTSIVTVSLLIILGVIVGAIFLVILLPKVFKSYNRQKEILENADEIEESMLDDVSVNV